MRKLHSRSHLQPMGRLLKGRQCLSDRGADAPSRSYKRSANHGGSSAMCFDRDSRRQERPKNWSDPLLSAESTPVPSSILIASRLYRGYLVNYV